MNKKSLLNAENFLSLNKCILQNFISKNVLQNILLSTRVSKAKEKAW